MMKKVPLIVGMLGMLVILAAVIGRFKNAPTVSIGSHHFAASSVILIGNTMILAAILLRLLGVSDKKD